MSGTDQTIVSKGAAMDKQDDLLEPPATFDFASPVNTGMDVDMDKLSEPHAPDWTDDSDERHDGTPSGDIIKASGMSGHGGAVGSDLFSEGSDLLDAQTMAAFQQDLVVLENLKVELKVAQRLQALAVKDATDKGELTLQLKSESGRLQERLKWTEGRIERLEAQLAEKEADNRELTRIMHDKSDKIDDMYDEIDKYCDEIDDLKADVAKLRTELDEYETKPGQQRKRPRKEESLLRRVATKTTNGGTPSSKVTEPTPADVEMMEAIDAETRARGTTYSDTNIEEITSMLEHVPPLTYQEQREREIAEARAKLPKSVIKGKMPKDLPTLESIGYIAPPKPPKDAKYATRNFPDDWQTYSRTLEIQRKDHVWVYGFRHFLIWLFATHMEPEERLPIHNWALAHYQISDWFAETLSAIHRDRENIGKDAAMLDALSRGKLEYNPDLFIKFIQYREIFLPGAPFLDDAFSVSKRAARGANLLDVLSIPRGKSKQASEEERSARGHLERLFVQVFATPGFYESLADDKGWMIADDFKPTPWPLATACDATIEEVVETMTLCGVSIAMNDDAWLYGFNVVQHVMNATKAPVGWTREAAYHLDLINSGGERPPSLDPNPDNEVAPRPPSLAWISKSERTVQFEFYDWYHPIYKQLHREPDSKLQDLVDKGIGCGRGVVRFNAEKFKEMNPWTSRKASEESSTKARTSPRTDKGKGRGDTAHIQVFCVKPVVRTQGAHPVTSRRLSAHTSATLSVLTQTITTPVLMSTNTDPPRLSLPIPSEGTEIRPGVFAGPKASPTPLIFGTTGAISPIIAPDTPPIPDTEMLAYEDDPPVGEDTGRSTVV